MNLRGENTSSVRNEVRIIKNEQALSVTLNKDNIIEVEFSQYLTEVTKAHLMHLSREVERLGNGKKMPVYIHTKHHLTITSEGRNYTTTPEGSRFALANAVLVDSFAKRILLNFYMEMNKPKIPLKSFSNKAAALEWLKTFL